MPRGIRSIRASSFCAAPTRGSTWSGRSIGSAGSEAVAVARRLFTAPTRDTLYRRIEGEDLSPASIRQLDVAQYFVGREWHTFDFRAELARIRCPTLILAGAYDPVMPFEGSEEMAACLNPELVRFEGFPDCGHALLSERPAQALALMEAFILEDETDG